MADNQKTTEKPKPVPVLTDSNIEQTGEKGNYAFFVFALDQAKKPMSEVQMLVFFGKEIQPRFRLVSNAHSAIEFPVQFTTEKITIGIKIGNLEKQTFELEGEQASSSVTEEEKNMGWWEFTVKRFSKALEKLRSKK